MIQSESRYPDYLKVLQWLERLFQVVGKAQIDLLVIEGLMNHLTF